MSDFTLDRTDNPHPAMLAGALLARQEHDDVAGRQDPSAVASRHYWIGYLHAMCHATGESAEAIEAWLDRHEVP